MQTGWIVTLLLFVALLAILLRAKRSAKRRATAEAEAIVERSYQQRVHDYTLAPSATNVVADEPRSSPVSSPAKSDDFVVLDLETTGFDPDRHQITQVAAKRCSNLRQVGDRVVCDSVLFTSYCKLRPQSRISREVQQLTGITPDLLRREGRPLVDVIKELHAFIGSSVVVAHNAEFDISFLKAAEAQSGVIFASNYVCTLRTARKVWPQLPRHRLADLAEHIGVSSAGAHNAVQDVEMTFWVYFAVMRAAGCVQRTPINPTADGAGNAGYRLGPAE